MKIFREHCASRHVPEEDRIDVYDKICDEVPKLLPNASAAFSSINISRKG